MNIYPTRISTPDWADVLTNVLQTNRSQAAETRESMAISTIILTELLYGAAKSGQPAHHRTEVERFCSRLELLPFDDNAAAHAADIRATPALAGQRIGA